MAEIRELKAMVTAIARSLGPFRRGIIIQNLDAYLGHLKWCCKEAGVNYSPELYDLALEAMRDPNLKGAINGR